MKHGYSPETVSDNIALFRREGRPQAQAVAMALASARRAFRARFPSKPFPTHLKPSRAAKPGKRAAKVNPAQPSRRTQLQNAVRLYEDFTGEEGDVIARTKKPVMPDVLLAIGEVDGIMYTTTRDGKRERYIHEFAKHARPLFAVSHDGRQLFMLGGAYNFTDRGIVDTR